MPQARYRFDDFPPQQLDWPRLIPLLGPAAAAIARFDGMLTAIQNADVLLSPLMTQEAVLSSRIEGTQATMGEVLEFEVTARVTATDQRRQADIVEVLNYRRAVRHAENLLAALPLSMRVVLEVHGVLLDGARGSNKRPGQLRKTANWIGAAGCPIEEADFVPATVRELPAAMSRWERYLHADAPDSLIQLALIHAEFEAIHPFLDGNGRLGRMLVPLFLWQRGLIGQPYFYMSSYLEAHRPLYYEHLRRISSHGDWTGWCEFFLKGLRHQGDANRAKAAAIVSLYERLKPQVIQLTRSQYAVPLLDQLFAMPIFELKSLIKDVDVTDATARRIVAELERAGIVNVLSSGTGRRSNVYFFGELLNIAEGRDVF